MNISREMRDLLNQMDALQKENQALIAKKDATADEVQAKLAATKLLQDKIDLQRQIDDGRQFDDKGTEVTGLDAKRADGQQKDREAAYQKSWLKAFRRKATAEDHAILAAFDPDTPADGGYLVPADITTAINEYKRDLPQLEQYVNVVPTTMKSGNRIYEKLATMTGFTQITDLTADLPTLTPAQFEQITFTIKDYGGILYIPNDLLQDSDQNIIAYLGKWIARKSVTTRNSLIATLMVSGSPAAWADWKAIKKAINIMLDPAFGSIAKIFTNQDGYQYLDTLVDGQSRPLLQPDVSKVGGNVLFGKQVVPISNNTHATTGTTTKYAPMCVGSLLDFITMFERKGYSIDSTNIGGVAFQKNQTAVRVIEREDFVVVDSAAIAKGKIDVTGVV